MKVLAVERLVAFAAYEERAAPCSRPGPARQPRASAGRHQGASVSRCRMLCVTVAVAFGLGACGDDRMPPKGSDEAALVACRSLLENVTDLERLASTVRDEGDGYVVNAWTNGQAKGVPDYVCDVERDEAAERGVVVVEVRPSPAR